jgi:hypothetical protein
MDYKHSFLVIITEQSIFKRSAERERDVNLLYPLLLVSYLSAAKWVTPGMTQRELNLIRTDIISKDKTFETLYIINKD